MSKATKLGPIVSRYDRNVIWAGKRPLDIRLSSAPVDVGQLLSFRLAQVDHHVASLSMNLVPTFKTSRMERTYNLEMKLGVQLDGNTYYAGREFTDVKVVSSEYAPGTTESQPIESILLQREAPNKDMYLNNARAPGIEREPPDYVDPTDPRSIKSDLDSLAALMSATDKV
jgi:hypothetical protein